MSTILPHIYERVIQAMSMKSREFAEIGKLLFNDAEAASNLVPVATKSLKTNKLDSSTKWRTLHLIRKARRVK